MNSGTKPEHTRVEQAERPDYEPIEYANESKETIWENPEDHDVVLEIYIGGTNYGRKPRSWEEKTAQRRYVIRAKETRAIPDEFDQAVGDHLLFPSIPFLALPVDVNPDPKALVIRERAVSDLHGNLPVLLAAEPDQIAARLE